MHYSQSYGYLKLGQNALSHAGSMKFVSKFMLGDENKFVTPQGGLVRLFDLSQGFTPNRWGSCQKNFLTRRTPLPAKMINPKCRFWQFCHNKNLNIEIVAEICDIECCRNFWQHNGGSLHQKCPETRIHEILYIIRKVIDI